MTGLEDLIPQSPMLGPPLPKVLGIRWSGLASNPSDRQEVFDLLRAHTTVESWGMPCISTLAGLMNEPLPLTREGKAQLIGRAEEYIRRY